MILLIGLVFALVIFSAGATKYKNMKTESNKDMLALVVSIVLGLAVLGASIFVFSKGEEICEYELISSEKYPLCYSTVEKGYEWVMTGAIRSEITFHYIDESGLERTLTVPSSRLTLLDTGFKGYVRIEKYSISMLKAVLFIKAPVRYSAITKL